VAQGVCDRRPRATSSPLFGRGKRRHWRAMENRLDPSPRNPGLIRLVGCLAYPVGAAIVAGLVYMILKLV
jgi:hypothetical protein